MAAPTVNALSSAPSSEEILQQVRQFIQGSSYEIKISHEELARCALYLLQNLPSARQAVLEHLANIFDDAVGAHMRASHVANGGAEEETNPMGAVIEDVQDVLMGFVKNSPEAWAPIISAWSIDLLGRISSKYADMRGVPHSSSLNELLQVWMTCKPTKTLIEIASECFASMVGDAPNVCVDALLEASVKHSPHFDWVVAHIGSCFPRTIINRVLMCGLKDFYHDEQQHPHNTAAASEEKIPKMASVVGILGHLAGHHGKDIREALLALFQASLRPDRDAMAKSTVAFLLHLASLSPLLLRALALDLVDILIPEVMNQLCLQFTQDSSEDTASLANMVGHLVAKMEDEAPHVLQFVLNIAEPPDGTGREESLGKDTVALMPQVRAFCATVLTHLLVDLHHRAHVKTTDATGDIPCLSALQSHVCKLCTQMTMSSGKRYQWLAQLLACLAVYSRESITTDILSEILLQAVNDKQLSLFVQIQEECQIKYPDVLAITLQKTFDQMQLAGGSAQTTAHGLTNILGLLGWECHGGQQETRCSLTDLIQKHLGSICNLLTASDTALVTTAIQILEQVAVPQPMDQVTVTRLCSSVVGFLFNSLHLHSGPKKLKCCHSCQKVLRKLCGTSSIARKMLLRFLLEGALSPDHAPAFGAKIADHGGTVESQLQSAKPCLLASSEKQGTGLGLMRGQTTVFHAGVIGQGLKPPPRKSPFTQEEKIHNRQIFISTLTMCSHYGDLPSQSPSKDVAMEVTSSGVSVDVTEVIAKLMVELVTPDVMYNAIVPWPDEDFMKITVERDLLIKKKFEENPLLWDIMDFLTEGPYSMCICSVLVRPVMATLLSHWEASRDKSAANSPRQLEVTSRVIQCLSKGCLLPPPLCYCSEILHLLMPHEVYLILLNIWRYMKENPPLPEPSRLELSKQICHSRFTEALRSILHKNINKLGEFYPRFFGLKPPQQ